MSRVKARLGYEDYAALDDGKRYELVDGGLRMVPATNYEHQAISGRLFLKLASQVHQRRLGVLLSAPLDVRLSEHDVVQPDLMFISPARQHVRAPEGLCGAPDLVIEILSPDMATHDRYIKAEIYHRAGVREMWIVDPLTRSIEVFLPAADGFRPDGHYHGDEELRSSVIPELMLRASDAFID